MTRRAGLLVVLAALLCGRPARAADPAQQWRTIDTPHFHIHYYRLPAGRGEEAVAERLATVAEDSYQRLVPYLGRGLGRKTHIVITDDTDDYNGSATVLPYPSIRLFATSPDDRAELNDYDDWLSALFTHEYTHVLHLGTIGGPCARIANALLGWGLGIVYSPNQSQPRWIIEGLAVFEETARTSGGRLRNSIWDMYLRAATLEHRFERLDQFTHDPIQFPFANSAYLYGSAFMRYIADHYGQGALAAMSRDYGSVCIPGGINRAIRHATGKTWVELYPLFRADLEHRYQAQRAAIAARGITPARALTTFRETVARPVWTPDGHSVIFTDSDGYTREKIRRIDVDGQGRKNGTELLVDGAGGPSLTADGRTLYFHAADVWRTFYFYNDIYAYDRVTHKKRRLTYGMRATNPSVSPDGKWVAFEVNHASSRGIGMMRTDRSCRVDQAGCVEMLMPARNFEQVYTPTFSPDGKKLAFSWWREGGWRDVYIMDLATRQLTRVTDDRSLDLEPRFSPDGRWLYFVSDRTGVYNLYAYELASGRLMQATNVVNGVFDPAISPDGRRLAFVGFVADGYDLQVADLDPARFRTADPPILDRPDAKLPRFVLHVPSHRYNPLPTLIPFTFYPYAQPDGYGEILGFQLAGSDAVGHHAWSLRLGFGTGRSDDVDFAANYGYSGLWPDLNIGVGHSLSPRGGLVINGRDIGYDEDDWTFGAGISLPLYTHIVTSSRLSLSYDLTIARNVSGVPAPDPSDLTPRYPETGRIGGLALSWSFQNLRRYTYSVSPESGRFLGVSLALASPVLGSQYQVLAANWEWDELVAIPWPVSWLRSHVLALSYQGGISRGDLQKRGLYYLGGYPPQNLLQSIYDFSRPGAAPLRGYAYGSVVGDQYHVLNAEYRFPIVWIERGYQTLPIYFQRLAAKVFADYGGAFFGDFAWDKLRLGAGAELLLDFTYGYFFPAALQLGYAHGFSQGGGNQVYFLLNTPF